MNAELQTKVQANPAQNFTPVRTGILQRKCALCNKPGLVKNSEQDKEKLTLHRSSADQAEPDTVPPIVHEVLRSSGQPLGSETRTFMEARLGHDFSKVRVHTDTKAAESARAVNALAYTAGRNIVFHAGHYVPGTTTGRKLLAHELTHVMQQQEGVSRSISHDRISNPNDQSEHTANRIAADVISSTQPDEHKNGNGMTPASMYQGCSNNSNLFLQRVVNERKVGCRTSGIPSLGLTGDQAVETIRQANEAAILMSQRAENNLFIDRLTFGDMPTDPTFATILNEELGLDITDATERAHTEIVERRFELIRTRVLESDFTGHTCIGASTVTLGSGTPAACSGDCCTGATRACSCTGVSHIVLCRPWWTPPRTDLRPATLLHESLHTYFGFINDHTNAKLNDAHCYTAFAARLAGITPLVSCAGR